MDSRSYIDITDLDDDALDALLGMDEDYLPEDEEPSMWDGIEPGIRAECEVAAEILIESGALTGIAQCPHPEIGEDCWNDCVIRAEEAKE